MAAKSATLMFGVGAAKAGTTWLAQALRAHKQVALPPFKEVHYFDSLETGTSIWAMDQLISVRQATRQDLAGAKTKKMRMRLNAKIGEMDRWIGLVGAQVGNDKRYETLMQRRAGVDTRLVADITPAYALLSEERLGQMAAMNGGNTRFVMVLRDPVDRLWSNLSMTATRRTKRGRNFPIVMNELLTELKSGDSRELDRSDYAGTLARLEAAVPEAQRMVLFFEELFDAATLDRLRVFLGLDDALEGPEKATNVGAGHSMDAATHTVLAQAMQPQYESVMSRFDAIPSRWQDNMKGPVQ